MITNIASDNVAMPMDYLFEFKIGNDLSPIIKWAGGKENEIKHIAPRLPYDFKNYYEPFVGGGSVYAAISAEHCFINDKCEELIDLYNCIAMQDEKFFSIVSDIISSWNKLLCFAAKNDRLIGEYKKYRTDAIGDNEMRSVIERFILEHNTELLALLPDTLHADKNFFIPELKKNLVRKINRMKVIEKQKNELPEKDIFDNVETAFMSALYMYYRKAYNSRLNKADTSEVTALFFFIRNYAYSGMFRYNEVGDFNVPYGGIAYNHKNLFKKIEYYKSHLLKKHFSNTTISCMDFADFFETYKPGKDDFIFLDPPYDSEFSTYSKNAFTKDDHVRLADFLLNKCATKWMLIIKNTDFIYSLYNKPNVNITTFDKTYQVSFMNRNNRQVQHLLIMNY